MGESMAKAKADTAVVEPGTAANGSATPGGTSETSPEALEASGALSGTPLPTEAAPVQPTEIETPPKTETEPLDLSGLTEEELLELPQVKGLLAKNGESVKQKTEAAAAQAAAQAIHSAEGRWLAGEGWRKETEKVFADSGADMDEGGKAQLQEIGQRMYGAADFQAINSVIATMQELGGTRGDYKPSEGERREMDAAYAEYQGNVPGALRKVFGAEYRTSARPWYEKNILPQVLKDHEAELRQKWNTEHKLDTAIEAEKRGNGVQPTAVPGAGVAGLPSLAAIKAMSRNEIMALSEGVVDRVLAGG